MAERDEGAYGADRLRLWYHGLRDRWRGEHARANARWGYLRPPPGRGRLIWLKTDASSASVHLGLELLGAIRQRRLDVRLVLSFEHDYPALISPHIQGLKKVAVGYGPCDAPRAVKRALDRLDPFALIYVNGPPAPHLLEAANRRGLHVVAFHTSTPAAGRVEASYPADAAQARAWRDAGAADYVAPAADALTLLVEAQVEPVLRSLARAGGELALWWLHGVAPGQADALLRAWRDSSLAAEDVLMLSTASEACLPELEAALRGGGVEPLRISTWQRTALEPGTVVLIDEPRWLPAVAASCSAAHLLAADRPVLWQALASGAPLGLSGRLLDGYPELSGLGLPREDALAAIPAHWERYRAVPSEARRLGDACRRHFWAERRRAGEVLQELLQRVFDW